MHRYQEQRRCVNVTNVHMFSVAIEQDRMENLKGQAGLFILGRAVWPTFDTYCDIIIGLYCIVYANVLAWGLVMVAPLIYHLVSVTSSYVRMRREGLLEKNDLTWIAIPFFLWPQVIQNWDYTHYLV